MNILLWSARGSGLQYGGPGMAAWRMYSELGDGMANVDLLHCHPDQEATPPYRHVQSAQMSRHLALNATVAAATVFRQASHYDAVHALTGYLPSLLVAAAARARGVPTLVKIAAHDSDLHRLSAPKHALARKVSGYVAISSEIERELLDKGIDRDRIVKIPNGTDLGTFAPVGEAGRSALRSELGLDTDAFTILFSGAIVRRKRPHLLLEAANQLAERGIRLQVCLAGPPSDPAYFEEVKRQAAASHGNLTVKFTGHVTQVHRYYQAADVFCLPCEREGMPNALVEAMAVGLPCVVTSASGVRDLVPDDDHGLVVAGDGASIAHALGELHASRNYREELGGRARERIQARFDRKMTLKAHLQTFKRLSEGKPIHDLGLF